MTEYIYRVMYRWNPNGGFAVHTSGKGTSTYGTLGAARGAVTQFRKRGWDQNTEYKIQRVPLGEWEDILDDV